MSEGRHPWNIPATQSNDPWSERVGDRAGPDDEILPGVTRRDVTGFPLRSEECVCVFSCAEDPATRCSLSGQWHVHPDDGTGTFGPCPAHPDAPGDL